MGPIRMRVGLMAGTNDRSPICRRKVVRLCLQILTDVTSMFSCVACFVFSSISRFARFRIFIIYEFANALRRRVLRASGGCLHCLGLAVVLSFCFSL